MDFFLDFVASMSSRLQGSNPSTVKGGNVLDYPNHTFHLQNTTLTIFVIVILAMGGALGGLILLT